MCYKNIVKCPICGKDNLELSWFGSYHFLEENYYVCPQCSYIRVMAYSPTLDAVCRDYCDDKWLRKVKELKVDIVGFEEYEHYASMLPRELMDILEEARKDDNSE